MWREEENTSKIERESENEEKDGVRSRYSMGLSVDDGQSPLFSRKSEDIKTRLVGVNLGIRERGFLVDSEKSPLHWLPAVIVSMNDDVLLDIVL